MYCREVRKMSKKDILISLLKIYANIFDDTLDDWVEFMLDELAERFDNDELYDILKNQGFDDDLIMELGFEFRRKIEND
jgi:hypothetical protein